MKKILLSISIALIFFNAQSQITLNGSTHTPVIGDEYINHWTTTLPNGYNQSGANIIWDFSSVSGTADTSYAINPSSASEPSTHPQSNTVLTDGNYENYCYVDNSEYSFYGTYIPSYAREVFTDSKEYIKFPITYSDTYNETFAGTIENIAAGQTYDRSGNIEITADGYGDLILPYGTISNVLRVLTVFDYQDEMSGTPFATYTDSVYTWYSLSSNTRVASVLISYQGTYQLQKRAEYLDQSCLSIDENDAVVQDLEVFPNPADNSINIKSDSQIKSLEIADITGKILININNPGMEKKIDVSTLNTGIYFVKYNFKDGYKTEKLVIE